MPSAIAPAYGLELVPGAERLVLEGMGHGLPSAYLGPVVEAITSLAARSNA